MKIKAQEIELLESTPKEITLVYVEAILMPNGELISEGKTLGFFPKLKRVFRVPQK